MRPTFDAVGFDYDGVLADSRQTAFAITEEISALFGIKASITSMSDYRILFREMEMLYAPEPEVAEVLRSLHRMLMRARAETVPIFKQVLALTYRISVEVSVITSGMRGTVLAGIGGEISRIRQVLGHENGLKEANLAAWSAGRRCVYVTDNIRDIDICRGCGVPSIAVGWGFDATESLVKAKPEWFARDPLELESLLESFNLLEVKHVR